ncbi:transport inhibitor response 1-like protein [Musa troglodytarum]|uniref:Transport inhibitor response 1-like protein n=1 Tax=Musa troglodytarum TaxID=320322 RepID=A0A9E7KIY7_9LILI|nr:transport inhibitor response 1-like protein [Musa troglodytarum]
MTGCFAGFRIDGRRKMISKSLVEGLLFLEKVFFVEVFGVQMMGNQSACICCLVAHGMSII